LLDEVVAVEVIRRLEGKERRHTHDHGTEARAATEISNIFG
jgi:hypothetical protein